MEPEERKFYDDWLSRELSKDDLIKQIPKLLIEIERLKEEIRAMKARAGKTE